jgi:S1-C subfamily serine protease
MTRNPAIAMTVLAAAGVAAAVALSGTVVANLEGPVRRTPVVAAVERAAPAVVNITTDALTRRGVGRGSGSGVIVHPDGYVVTNSHVVRGAHRIFVSLCKKSGERPFQATVVEDDPSHDLALLRVKRTGAFPYVRLCPTSEVMVGETAIAIGNPFGLGDTVTVGIISATGRRAAMPNGATLRNLLQTDASINLGNSGGALLNLDGALIGVNCSIHPTAQGISFTVPADDVRAMLDKQLKGGRRVPDATPAPAPAPAASSVASREKKDELPPPARTGSPGSVGMTLETVNGTVRIAAIQSDSSADIAGLREGDLILEMDDDEVEMPSHVEKALSSGYPGRTYFVGIQRGNERKRAILVFPGT